MSAPKLTESPRPGGVAPHQLERDTVVAIWRSDAQHGLSESEAASRHAKLGANELREAPSVPAWRQFVGQFQQLVVWILIVAALVAAATGEWIDAGAILTIVLLNAILGFVQEHRAEQSLAALRKLSAPLARVVRNGAIRQIPAQQLVVGDVVELEAGDNIPADVRLLRTYALQTQEAALTGESTPVEKSADHVSAPETPLGDRKNMAFLGAMVIAGRARALVTAIGMNTELGHIAGMMQAAGRETTPLERRLAELGKKLIVLCLVLVAIIFALHIWRGGEWLDVLLLSVSLAVAAVPEGLPSVVTICLALGLQRMAKQNALVRKLPSVETLGSVTVICSDKTGTLTRNEMTVRQVLVGDAWFEVTGTGYEPKGEFQLRGAASSANTGGRESDLKQALRIGYLCNDAQLLAPDSSVSGWRILGDPTEGALLVAAAKAGWKIEERPPLLDERPFDPERRAMSVVYQEVDHALMCVKGAPEELLSQSKLYLVDGEVRLLDQAARDKFQAAASEMASHALRVLALAYRRDPARDAQGFVESELVFAALVGMIDPPRIEVRPAIEQCRAAGVRTVMITGDHPETARAIAAELGLVDDDRSVASGQQLDRWSPEELANESRRISVFARASAAHKLKIVQALKTRGETVAMTGDGVNDAPAVKAADIGIAMGVTGTDVTKQASHMVLMDDNFASIVGAVAEGRRIYDNIQKVIRYLLSCNAGEVMFMFATALLGWPAPLLAVQILWINLVTDGIPAIALALEPPDPDQMRHPPRPRSEPVITRQRALRILRDGLLMALAATIAFWWRYDEQSANLAEARTTAFCVLVVAQLFFSLACRSERSTMLELGPFSNAYLFIAITLSAMLQWMVVSLPWTRGVFGVEGAISWPVVLLIALFPATAIELGKIVGAALRRRSLRVENAS
ncbi:MAG: cation-translocating P-type ATPase [Pirellulales bacterium]|nr:cation-translocating P-type ATPase [Pirellulales bacterium]